MPVASILFLATPCSFLHLPHQRSSELERALVEIEPHYNMADSYMDRLSNKVNYVSQAI